MPSHPRAEDTGRVCPLCLVAGETTDVRGADQRRYYLCHICSLIFTDARHHLSAAKAKALYSNHRNSIANAGYVAFLNRVVEPMRVHLNREMKGLDYGCGPGPTLSLLLKQQGIACENYDPLFENKTPQPPYDFVFSTECFEHFDQPDLEIRKIVALLKPGGLLAIMTERWTTLPRFASWYYTRDPTHICFYRTLTFDFICNRFGFTPVWMGESRVAILRRAQILPESRPAFIASPQASSTEPQ